jgi:hypothetical protein
VSDGRLPAWRIGAGLAVLAALLGTSIFLVPVYVRDHQLKNFLRASSPLSDEILQKQILSQGRALGLDVLPDHIQIRHAAGAGPTDVRYVIHVTLPLYTVDLHFSSSIGDQPR